MKYSNLLVIFLFILALSSNAQITTDGTLGSQLNLSGPNYQIGADLGQQHGGNLFHSFQDFNLNSSESATFSGPNTVQNVISRVTGGNPSNIDGLIRSTIPNADMYFLNPYGIMFGANAKLDVQGGFHASTADYLRLGEKGRFDARNPSDSILTIAPIESFGFLTHTPSSLSMKDTQLSLLPTTIFSLIGGDLNLKNTQLAIPSGRFNLASVAEMGEISASTFATDTEKQGTIKIFENSVIDVSGLAAGAIAINGGDLLLKNSFLRANAYGDFDGLGIDLNLTESVDILQTYVVDNEIFAVTNQNFGGGSVTGINIKTPILSLYRGGISTTSFGTGQGGHINIETGQMLLDLGASVATGSIGSGDAGHININAQQSLSLLGQNTGHFEFAGFTFVDFPSFITSDTYFTGAAGNINITTGHLELQGGLIGANHDSIDSVGSDITINANSINVTSGGIISTAIYERAIQGGGSLTLNVKDTLMVSGKREGITTDIFGGTSENFATMVGTGTYGNASAGFFSINADTLIIKDEAIVSASTARLGNAGTIDVSARHIHIENNGLLTVSSGGIQNNTFFAGGGQGGSLTVQADTITLENGGGITANSFGTGQAGDLSISANQLNLINNGNILTSAANATGGNISLNISNLLHLQQGEITTSVHGGAGDGGNITIENLRFVIMDNSQIIAQADEGRGGNIRIVVEQFLKSPESLISASSRLGLDGKVQIDSPAIDLDAMLVVLPGGYLDEVQLKQCDRQEIENLSTLKVDLIRNKSLPF